MEKESMCQICKRMFASKFSLQRHAQAVHNKKREAKVGTNNGNNINSSVQYNNNNHQRIDNLEGVTGNRNHFWEQMVDETVKHLQHKEGLSNNDGTDEYFEDTNLDSFIESLRQKIFDLQELCNAGATDSVMMAIQATKQEIANKFSNVLSDEDKDQLSWEQWKFVIKKRVMVAKKSLYDDSDTED